MLNLLYKNPFIILADMLYDLNKAELFPKTVL